MNNLGGVFCPICLNYFSKPVTAACSHCFCEYCLEQYFLHFDTCPICEASIRKEKTYKSNTLANFVQNFVRSEHPEYLNEHENRIQKFNEYKLNKMLGQFSSGQNVDIRDQNYIWRVGRIIRIISRVGQSHKFLKIQYLDCNQKLEEQVKVISERLAKFGFYTSRSDIPKYQEPKK